MFNKFDEDQSNVRSPHWEACGLPTTLLSRWLRPWDPTALNYKKHKP